MVDYGHHPYPPTVEVGKFNYIYDTGGMADPTIVYVDHRSTVEQLEQSIGTLRDIAVGQRYHDDWGEQVGGYSGVDLHTSDEDIVAATRSVGNAALNIHRQLDASRELARFFLPQLCAKAKSEMLNAMNIVD